MTGISLDLLKNIGNGNLHYLTEYQLVLLVFDLILLYIACFWLVLGDISLICSKLH